MENEAQVDDYLAEHYWAEDELQRSIRADTAARGPSIEVSAESGRFLSVMAQAIGAKRILEVGTLFGYSGVWMARQLPEDGHLDTVEFSELHADAATHWFAEAGLADKVTVHRGRGVDVIATLSGPYDMAFIDADKPSYPDYATMVLERLRPGGVMVFDNTIWSGRIVDPDGDANVQAIRAVHDFIAASDELVSTTLTIGDGMTVAVKAEAR